MVRGSTGVLAAHPRPELKLLHQLVCLLLKAGVSSNAASSLRGWLDDVLTVAAHHHLLSWAVSRFKPAWPVTLGSNPSSSMFQNGELGMRCSCLSLSCC
jgi:hypothetical protein